MYDQNGFHPDKHKAGEFYGEFGTFDVSIDLPSRFVVAATGTVIEGDPGWNYNNGGAIKKSDDATRKTVRFRAENVHDFAWSADPSFVVQDTTWNGQNERFTDQNIIRKEMSECMREFIDKLSPDYKTVVILSELVGFKNREIAEILQVTLDTVKIRLHRARTSLKEELGEGCSFYHNEEGTFACDRKPISIESIMKSKKSV